jgi:uncharacterized protein YodC (DUF2158 family)
MVQMPELKTGDVVRLKSGGPKMTIDSIDDYGSGNSSNIRAMCIWFDGGERKEGNFPPEALETAKD